MGMRASTVGLFLAAMSGLPLAVAQNADKPVEYKVPPAPAPGSGGKPAAAPVTDGKSALAAAAKAMADAKWISYQAKVEGVGMNGDYTATVTLERAEAGGWKVAVKGELKGKSSSKGRPFEVAFDGASVRSIRESEKQVGQLTDPADLNEMMLFFAKERAASPVAWETLGEKAFTFSDTADLKLEEAADIDGQKCHAVRVTIKDAKPAGEGVDALGGLYTFSAKDHMLRKIERFRPNAKPGDKAMRTVTFDKVEASETPKGGTFALSVPKGYTVKTEAGKKGLKPIEKAKEDVKKPAGKGTFNVGDPATAFEGKNLDGATVKFPEDFKGKVVLIDFWATWCGPCMAEVPHIVDSYKKFSGDGLEVLGVTIDKKGDASKVKQTVSNKSMSWVHIHDADSAIATIYKVTSIPRALLVDGDTGLILAEGNSLRGKQLEETIERAIQAKKKK